MRLIDADVLKQDLTRFYDGEVTAKELIDAQPTVGGWVSVEDRVPESNEIVLVYAYDENGDGYMAMAVRYPCGDWDSEDDYFNQMESEVRYWMPLPTPPEVNRDDD